VARICGLTPISKFISVSGISPNVLKTMASLKLSIAGSAERDGKGLVIDEGTN
jgi:hypothetical protein